MVFDAIKKLIVEFNDSDPDAITLETTFKDLGIDSLDTAELLINLEETVGKEIELDEEVTTVGDLVAFVEKKLKE
ncbi:MAG: acyl carrier protein [Clostridiales Family XIII bacterium]|nr:acyl carrier protein [Clostridiales Family XIII bacterium]